MLLCLIAPALAGDITVPTFTNEDLKRYKSREREVPSSQKPMEENKKDQAKRELAKIRGAIRTGGSKCKKDHNFRHDQQFPDGANGP